MRIESLKAGILSIENWTLLQEENWCVLGGNASGKSLLAAVIASEVPFEGKIQDPPSNPISVSLESLQKDYEKELANDDTDFLDRIDYGSTGLEILEETEASEGTIFEYANRFGISHLLSRGCRQFSSGELRRIYLLREILRKPDLLILDEPFEGLDVEGRASCSKLIESFIASGHSILLLANRIEDVEKWITHVALLKKGQFPIAGKKSEVLGSPVAKQLLQSELQTGSLPERPNSKTPFFSENPLLRMRNCSVSYDGILQFEGFNWKLAQGEHTLVTGPNGSGKSTLLNLISGDHPQCYANDIEIFGYKRGSGESIWDIKRQLGMVSPSLHRDYRTGGSLETVVLSGFFDSIGLYEKPAASQRDIARQWLALFGMEELAGAWFRSLSYGQQRLGLVARALVKQPPLLILDEPTQGLDDANRHLVLSYLEKLADLKSTTLLFVSHREDEHLSLFEKQLRFEPDRTKAALFTIFQS